MIISQNGVISTSDDSVLHMSWYDERDGWQTCQVPAHMHRDAQGEMLSCPEAAKYAAMKPGQRILKRIKANAAEVKGGPLNFPR